MDQSSLNRKGIASELAKPFLYGEAIRDWAAVPDLFALAPYDNHFDLTPLDSSSSWARHLWLVRSSLEQVVSFGGKTRKQLGDKWWGWYRWIPERYRAPR